MVRGLSRRPSMERSNQQEHCRAVIGTRPYKKVRDRINAHLPVVLKLVNTVALVVIALSSVCAADSLKEMSGKGAAPAAVTETN